jgi:hypothetical protein
MLTSSCAGVHSSPNEFLDGNAVLPILQLIRLNMDTGQRS